MHSALPRSIVSLLDSPRSLSGLADELDVTDARVLWYLTAPESIDRAATPKYGFHWVLTPTDLHPLNDGQ